MVKPVLFGKFCLLERISVGGMAEVFRAKPLDAPGFEKFLAVKRILPNLAEDDEFIEMFIDEAKIAVQLGHRNICQIFELGRLNDSHYIVMEFISGRDILAIQNRMRRERRIMSVGQAAYLTRQIACGLDAAHRKTDANGDPLNIIHRDISPQNVLVSYTGEVKVIDFGIAKAANKSNKTQVGVLKGKFGYMSPEQVKGNPLDHRSDIFALGTLLHEMLTCRRLFHGESDFATLEKVRKADVPMPSELNPNVPPEVDAIVRRALQPDPEERYQWCSEMMDELDNFLSKLRPPYTERTLANWMQRTFAEELEGERKKRQAFAQFKSAEDVKDHNEKLRQELAAKMGLEPSYDGKDVDQISNESTQIWDPAMASLPGADDIDDDMEDATIQDVSLAELRTQIANVEDLLGNIDEAGPTVPTPMHIPPGGLSPPPAAAPPVAYVPPSMAHLYPNAAPPPDNNRVNRLGIALVSSFVLFSLLILGVVIYIFFFSDLGKPEVPQGGSLIVKTSPIQDVEVHLNGELIATRTPHSKSSLAPGRYTLEVRHSDYKPATQIVTIENGTRADVRLDLKPIVLGTGFVNVNLDPPEAELFVDGKLMQGSGGSRRVELTERSEHLLEARLAGYYVAEGIVEVSADQTVSKNLKLRKLNAEITLNSAIKGKIFLNGTRIGVTPKVIEDLDPRKVYEIEIRAPGYHPWRKNVLFFQSYKKSYTARLRPERDPAPPQEVLQTGALTIDTGPTWWRVVVDGWDTGATTPVTKKGKLILPVGNYKISFVRGDQEHTVDATIEEGKTLSLDKPYTLKGG